ncbi:MAG TPA: hypothetical protein VD887_01625 [Allosphingosinicella sp.]|nr:hypothetical protein [Allosphingosinicella sp.]
MAERIRAELEPIYGWGWTGDKIVGPIRETPAPFAAELDAPLPGPCTGIVVTEGHEFVGMTVDLARRHEEWDGTLNVSVLSDGRIVTEGWALADPAGFSNAWPGRSTAAGSDDSPPGPFR